MSTKLPTVTVVLGTTGVDCQVMLDGIDISRCLTGMTIEANVHERTRVTLDVLAGVELIGEPGELLRGIPRSSAVHPPVVEAVIAPPGAVIVARYAGKMSEQMREVTGASLAECFPDRRVLVLDDGMDLSVLIEARPSDPPEGGKP